MVRLEPDAFVELPESISLELRDRGCTIPQVYSAQGAHNVIEGRFLSAVSHDWAVLCSKNRFSRVLIFPNGRTDEVLEWEETADSNWLQTVGFNTIGYSHFIAVASPEAIIAHRHPDYPIPASIDHDGIHDGFAEKGSTIRYWYEGRWLELAGVD